MFRTARNTAFSKSGAPPSSPEDVQNFSECSSEESHNEEPDFLNTASTGVDDLLEPPENSRDLQESALDVSESEPVEIGEGESTGSEGLSSDSESELCADSDFQSDYNIQDDELGEPLFPGAKLTRAESFLLVMAHSLRHGCSKEGTESLVNLISAHLPTGTRYPTSKYSFFQQFSGTDTRHIRHFYCYVCMAYIGELSEEKVSCSQCQSEHTLEGLVK